MTLQEAIKKFYKRCLALNVTEQTLENYRYQFKALAEYFAIKGIARMEDVTPDTVRDYLGHMRLKEYAPETVKDRFVGLNTLFRFLCEDGYLATNPVQAVKRPRLPKIKARTFTTGEIQKMLTFFDTTTFIGMRNNVILGLLFGTGIRRGELLGLTIYSLQLDDNILTVIGKGNKERTIPLSAKLSRMLRKYLKMRQELLLDRHVETSVLIIGKWGNPLTEHGLREMFDKLRIGTGLGGRRFSPHTFRHSFAKTFLMNGGSMFALQRILGHDDISTTQVYVEFCESEMAMQMNNYCPLDNTKWSYS